MIFVEASEECEDETWTMCSVQWKLPFDIWRDRHDASKAWFDPKVAFLPYVVYSRAFYGLVRPRPGHLGDEVSQIKNVDERFTFMFYKRNINENFRGVNFGSLGL